MTPATMAFELKNWSRETTSSRYDDRSYPRLFLSTGYTRTAWIVLSPIQLRPSYGPTSFPSVSSASCKNAPPEENGRGGGKTPQGGAGTDGNDGSGGPRRTITGARTGSCVEETT